MVLSENGFLSTKANSITHNGCSTVADLYKRSFKKAP